MLHIVYVGYTNIFVNKFVHRFTCIYDHSKTFFQLIKEREFVNIFNSLFSH